MKGYFKYILITVFFNAIIIIVFLQFNSNRNINRLIDGNEGMLQSQQIKTNMQELQKYIFALDADTRATVINNKKNDRSYTELSKRMEAVLSSKQSLDSIVSDTVIAPFVTELKKLIDKKIEFNNQILDTLKAGGKYAAEKLIANSMGIKYSDSISVLAEQIDELHEKYAKNLIDDADLDGERAKTFGSVLAILAILASILTFSYLSYKMGEQKKMIAKLNISEQKARESAIVKEHFLANMSHEIRTPLNAILGFTELLRKKNLEYDAEKYVGFISLAGDNLSNIVNDVLDLSKIEAGMLGIESAPFDFKECVEKTISVYQAKAAEKNLQLIKNISRSIPQYILGDAKRLNQILTNLIGNSLKFTHEGKITVKCSVHEKTYNTITLSIIIADTGIGIKQDQLNHIFERFRQSDETSSRRYGGTGLGLAIVKDLVRLMNGSINVESTEGVGTNFKLLLPFKVTSNETPQEIVHPFDGNPVFEYTQKILVAEDNEINQSLMEHLLSSWNINFDIAKDGSSAVEKVQNNAYALILMDIQMPDMDGYKTTTYIRNHLKATMPIIAMTAHAMAGEKEKCVQHGMTNYISKPIDARELKALLLQYLPVKKIPEHTTHDTGYAHPFTTFKYINTSYLKSISLGNKEYEKAVTGQFIEIVPQELLAIKNAWAEKKMDFIKETAHNLKTTVSIMGILPLVQQYLDELEHEKLDEAFFIKNFEPLSFICSAALQEADIFLKSI